MHGYTPSPRKENAHYGDMHSKPVIQFSPEQSSIMFGHKNGSDDLPFLVDSLNLHFHHSLNQENTGQCLALHINNNISGFLVMAPVMEEYFKDFPTQDYMQSKETLRGWCHQ